MSLKVKGAIEIDAPPERIFDTLLDPDVLSRCIPGCQSLEHVSGGEYAMVVKAGVGAVKGVFKGKVVLSDIERFEGYRMEVVGKSNVGHLQGDADIRLEVIESGTRVSHDGGAKVSGIMAAVGSRLLEAAARKVSGQFFQRLAEEVSAAQAQ